MYTAPLILIVIFSFVIIITIIGQIGNILKERVKAQAGSRDYKSVDYELRLEKLEQRIINLETIVLEKEREKKFSSL